MTQEEEKKDFLDKEAIDLMEAVKLNFGYYDTVSPGRKRVVLIRLHREILKSLSPLKIACATHPCENGEMMEIDGDEHSGLFQCTYCGRCEEKAK